MDDALSQASKIVEIEEKCASHLQGTDCPFFMLYETSKKFFDLSFTYASMRQVHKKSIISFPLIKQKLDHAESMLRIYQIALESKLEKNYFIYFINSTWPELLENLLFIHGASGYMVENEPTLCWIECRAYLKRIRLEIDHE